MAHINGKGLVEYLPAGTETANRAAEPSLELGDLRSGRILSAVGYEGPSLVFAALPHVGALGEPPAAIDRLPSFRFVTTELMAETQSTRKQIDSFMFLLQGQNPFVTVCADYFSSRAKNLASGYEELLVRYKNDDGVDVYQLTESGYWLGRPVAGWLLKWGYDFNIPLRHVLGSPRKGRVVADAQAPETNDISVADSTLTRFGALACLSEAGKGAIRVQDVLDKCELPLGRNSVTRHLEDLHEKRLISKQTRTIRPGFNDATYRLNPEKKEAVDALLLLYVRMNTYDKAFYIDGHHHADKIISNPGIVDIMMQRIALTDERMAKGLRSATPVITLARRNGSGYVHPRYFYS